MDMYISNLHTC